MKKETEKGHLNPLSIVLRKIGLIFDEMGFEIVDGPHIETEFYNFDTLNIPANHPARDMWDTFWLKDGKLLRTHTSPVQAHYMEKNEPPIKIIAPGKVFRYEATDATHEAQFYQLEGLMIGKDVSMKTLRGVLKEFLEKFFGGKIELRFRPSYFPFVEPGIEVDMKCFKCEGRGDKGCSVCKGTGWIEIMGAGMVHPVVLNNSGIDHQEWQGFAFGVGVDRLAMLKYGITDIRLFYSGDLRLTNQF